MSTSSTEALDLKRRALALKKEGDVEGALDLLRQAKQLEQQEKAEATVENVAPASEVTELPKSEEDNPVDKAEGELPDDIADDDEDMDLDDLFENGPISYTDDEMQDCELMTEFKLGGMPVPTDEEYQTRILATKRTALSLKNKGDIAGAKEQLAKAKEMEKVRIALSHMKEGLGLRIHDDMDGWLEELTENDSALVGNILNDNSDVTGGMTLSLEEIEEMSPDELQDAALLGMALPTQEEVLAKANEKKTRAVQCKHQGDLEGARVALHEYKMLQVVADKLQAINQGGEKDTDEISMQALESLLDGNGNDTKKKVTETPNQRQVQKKTAPVKTADELKQEAVRLRNENKMKEATQVFKLYKEALKRENEAAETKRCQEIVASICEESLVAKQQRRLFQFYERFVDDQLGRAQLTCWDQYAQKCADVTRLVEAKGKPVTVSRTTRSGLMCIQESDLIGLLELGLDSSEERLEVAILDVRNLHDNHAFQKLFRKKKADACHILRVQVTIQIPLTEAEKEKYVDLVFESAPSEEPAEEYHFVKSQYVAVPRGESKFAETVRRRLDRRRIQANVYHVPYQKKSKGWFGSRSNASQEDIVPTLVGKVVLDLKDLLKRNCIAGDFDLVNARGSAGGTVGFVARTGVPFNSDKLEATSSEAAIEPYEAMSFALPKEIETVKTRASVLEGGGGQSTVRPSDRV